MNQCLKSGRPSQVMGACVSLAAFAVPGWAYAMRADNRPEKVLQSSFSDFADSLLVEQSRHEAPPMADAAPPPAAGEDLATLDDIRTELRAQRQRLSLQEKVIEAQRKEIETLHAQIDSDGALKALRGAGAPPTAAVSLDGAQVASSVPQQSVGVAPPPEQEITPKVSSIPEGQGVLTARGATILETSFEYTRSSNNRLVFRGVELIPGLQVGLIEASDVDSDTFIGTIAVRHGLSNRLEIEARMPVLARLDRIRITQLRNQGIVREINLNGYEVGDAEIGLRYQLNAAKGPEEPIYVANLRLKSNTGKSPFAIEYDEFGVAKGLATGSGFWGLQAGASFLLPSDPAVIYGGLSYLWHIPRRINKTIGGALIGRVDPGDAVSANLGFGFALNPRFSFSLGYNHSYIFPTKTEIGTTNQRSKGLQVGALAIGASYRLSERQSVNLGFEFGVTSDAPDMSLTLRLPLRF
jgi:hypothetical protein